MRMILWVVIATWMKWFSIQQSQSCRNGISIMSYCQPNLKMTHTNGWKSIHLQFWCGKTFLLLHGFIFIQMFWIMWSSFVMVPNLASSSLNRRDMNMALEKYAAVCHECLYVWFCTLCIALGVGCPGLKQEIQLFGGNLGFIMLPEETLTM